MRGPFASALAALSFLVVASVAPAADAPPAKQTDVELETLRDQLARTMPEVQREDIRRTPAAGLFEVRTGNAFGYVTADGRYLLSGDIVDLDSGERVTEERRKTQRLITVNSLAGGATEFAPASPDKPREWITVFTDYDCQYCRLLHREVPRLNELGYGVRYLFSSQYGAPSKAYDHAQAIWCSDDRRRSLDAGLLQGALPKTRLCQNPVGAQYAAAEDMGLRGTPMIILPDGSLSYGYIKADALDAEIRRREAAAASSGRVDTSVQRSASGHLPASP